MPKMKKESPEHERGEYEHYDEPDRARDDAGEHEASQVFGNGQRRGEEVEEVPGPDILEKGHGYPLHDPDEEIPEHDRAQEDGHEVEPAGRDGIEVFRDEAPEHDSMATQAKSGTTREKLPRMR